MEINVMNPVAVKINTSKKDHEITLMVPPYTHSSLLAHPHPLTKITGYIKVTWPYEQTNQLGLCNLYETIRLSSIQYISLINCVATQECRSCKQCLVSTCSGRI